MSAQSKAAQDLAKRLLILSRENGMITEERVGGVLEYLEKHRPANPVQVLKAYRRLVAAELGRSQALVEHAGPIPDTILASLSAALARKNNRPISTVARANPELIAGLRVRLGDDVYEASVAGQLAALAANV